MTLRQGDISAGERIGAFILLAVVFAFGLFDHSLWAANDAREGAMIAEMLRTGTWVTPVFNGVPYLEKPPLMHWIGVLICNLFGTVNEGLVRLPAALFGFGAVIIAYLWARDMGRERAGLAAAFMCATSVQYFEYSKVVLTDTAIAFMVILSLYLFWKAYSAERHKPLLYAVFITISAFSFYAKGLLGPGCVWIAVCGFLLYHRRWKLLFGLPLIFLPIFILALAPWAAALWRAGGFDMIRGVFWDNQFGRFFEFSNANLPRDPYFVHKEPITYYLFNLPLRMMPWTLLVVPAMVHWCRRDGSLASEPAVLLRFAVGAILLVLHVSTAKATAYALPLYPLVFLMTGLWLDDVVKEPLTRVNRWLVGITIAAFIVALSVPPVIFIVLYLARLDHIWCAGAGTATVCFLIALMTAALAAYAIRRIRADYRRGCRSTLLLPMLTAASCLIIMNAAYFYPVYDNQRTYVPLVRLVEKEMDSGRRICLASPHERDCGQFMFYLGQRIEVVSIETNLQEAFCLRGGPAAVIVPEKDTERIIRYLSIACDDRERPAPGPYKRQFRTLRSDHSGYKARDFILILNDR